MARGPVPGGFDSARLQAAAASLANKRAQSVARTWPGMADALGDRFAERFAAFAATTPLPRHGGPLADGHAFARWLASAGELPAAVRLHLLAVELRYAVRSDGLVPRRGPALKAVLLRQPRRLVIAVRMPWLGERWFTIPLRGKTAPA
jgi:hypothetical protein